jgi:hypothetical protein
MVGAQAFMHATKQGTSFAIYAIKIQENSKPCTRIPIQYQDFMNVFEKKMLIYSQSIDHMIVILIYKKELNLHLDQFTIYQKMNLDN